MIEDKNNIYKKNNITHLLEICEKIFENYILKYKFKFLDFLLNEWYTVNKTIITDKINDLENINTIYVYNCHKFLLYTISSMATKYKMKVYFRFINNYNTNIMKRKLIIIRKTIFIDLKNKISEGIKIKHELKCAKEFFIYVLINNNIHSLQKENSIKQRHFTININLDKTIYGIISKLNSFLKWVLFANKYNDIEKIIYFYFDKIKFFQCKVFILIYKRKLKHIYNIFINKIINESDKYSLKMNKLKNKMLLLSILNPLNKCVINAKNIFCEKITNYHYLLKKINFFVYIISFFINNLINRYKYIFINNLKKYINIDKINYNFSF